jgi:hypothetical protein
MKTHLKTPCLVPKSISRTFFLRFEIGPGAGPASLQFPSARRVTRSGDKVSCSIGLTDFAAQQDFPVPVYLLAKLKEKERERNVRHFFARFETVK